MTRVGLHHGGEWDNATVRGVLEVDPLDVKPLEAPALSVDGLLEPDATAWLRHVASRSFRNRATTTPMTRAQSLRGLLQFLTERNVSLRGATNQHILEYINSRIDGPHRVSGNTLANDRTAIKQFYEWLREEHNVPLPITIDQLKSPRGPVSSMREGRGIPTASAASTPLEPPQLDELMAAAVQYGANQAPNGSYTGIRDAAFIALGAACGGRASTLTHLTTYEIPTAPRKNSDRDEGDLISMHLPAALSKVNREVRLPAFRHHLDTVRAFIDPKSGARRFQITDWRPDDPITIAVEPTKRFHGIIDTDGIARSFNEMTADVRRRLLKPNGEPAMIFLTAHDGRPLKLATAREITGDVSIMAEADAARRGGDFPHVHTHDLRATYASPHSSPCD
ncbi:site-specific integrase [Curtobacterium sp. VKM Ac-2884]|uniref:site-specific integrase n=1 Tax=Curtobacterium sp. VKM Ac-2884 TaxID=2783818 RepID=UPI00188B14DA|nr:site-specific integrase [Curtobacterium sp. VKM Ac-2884]MBF4603991.1 site-specific integrase [Curtobacterium sp. VKM Ac-2884]